MNPFIQFAAESHGPHVSLPAEAIFHIGSFPITNSMILGLLGYALTIWALWYTAGKVRKNNKNRFVSGIQWVFEMLYSTVEQVVGDKQVARRLAPLAITLFFFIFIQYVIGTLPGVGPITVNGTPIFRSLVADLNTTFALAIITMVMAQVYAIKKLGVFGNLGRYFRNPFKDVAGAFEGILELVAEFSRLVGLSLRLFGNVFAGEILLMMIAYLTKYATVITLPPFLAFELFIGGVQAYIFFMLTVVFISLGLSHAHDSHDETHSDHSTPDAKKTVAAGGSDN